MLRVTRPGWLPVATGASIVASLTASLLLAGAAQAEVEPGYYFDPNVAGVGAVVHVRAVEVGFCDDVAFSLAPAGVAISGPADANLRQVSGDVRHDELGDTEFVFTVPPIAHGRYLGYAECVGTFGPTSNELRVRPVPPSTDVGSRRPAGEPPAPWPLLVLLVLGGLGGALVADWRLRAGRGGD